MTKWQSSLCFDTSVFLKQKMKHGDKTTKLLTLNRVHKMELNYIKEHTSCVNYKTEEDTGFALLRENISTTGNKRLRPTTWYLFCQTKSASPKTARKKQESVRANSSSFPFHPITRARLSSRAHTSVCHSFTMQSHCATSTCLAAI